MQVILCKSTKAQEHVNYSPSFPNYNYASEKVYTAMIDNDLYSDIVTYDANASKVSFLINNGNTSYSNNISNMEFASSIIYTDINLLANEKLIDVQDMDGNGYGDLLTVQTSGGSDLLYVYYNSASGFAPVALLPNNNNNLSTGNYIYGTAKFDNDNILDVYAYSGTTLFILNSITNYASISVPNNIVQLLPGKYSASGVNNELVYITKVANALNPANADYTLHVLGNTSTNLTTSFSTTYAGTSNTQFLGGRFTNDLYTDIAIYDKASGAFTYNEIKMCENSSGANFIVPLTPWQSGLTSLPANFKLDAADFSSNTALDDIILIQAVADISYLGDLGKVYVEQNQSPSTNSFLLTEFSTSPCGANPINSNSADWQVLHDDFNNDGQIDVLIYNPSIPKLNVGLIENLSSGYCWPLSAKQNEDIHFYIKGNVTNLDIYKYESRNDIVISSLVSSIVNTPINQITNADIVKNGCGWLSTSTLTIPSGWESGYYAAELTLPNCEKALIPFIVNKSTPNTNVKKLTLIANTNTWCAYNFYTDGAQNGSKYLNDFAHSKYQDYSFMRPFHSNIISSNERPHLARAELWIYTWLKDNGYDPYVITDIDVHQNTNNFLNTCDYLVMGTHPEYWTGKMYDNVKNFQENGGGGNGGNLICLGGNAVFEVVDLDLNITNPKLIAYPNAPANATLASATIQQNTQYPLPGMAGVGGESKASPYWDINTNKHQFDRFDYFLESYNFGTSITPIHKRTIDLIGTHYQNINSFNVNNTSYTSNVANSLFLNGLNNPTEIGDNGYCTQNGVVASGAGASGWECERYSPAIAPTVISPLTPASPMQTSSVYDNDIQILYKSTPNSFSDPQQDLPNGMNNSEIIYVPPYCGMTKRGFVFTAGSITFGGSLVWNYDAATNTYNNDLSRLMINVLNHTPINLSLETKNGDCASNGGEIKSIGCNIGSYTLLPNNITNNTGLFTSLANGSYTVVAVDANNNSNTMSKTAVITGPTPNHCNSCQQGENLVTTANVILLDNPSANYINSNYTSLNNFISNRTFYIDGTLTIDENITFSNCTLYFTPTGQIVLAPGKNINIINSSTLQAACDTWLGITASDPANKVSMSNSTMQNATSGILISNNATLEATNCLFKNNPQINITYLNMSSPSYAGKVWHCTFEGDNMTPYNGITKPQVGVAIMNSDYIDIGDALNENNGNTFTNIYNGIYIYGGAGIATTLPSNNIGIYNNKFVDINNGYGQTTYNQIMQDIYNSNKGSAIYIDYSSAPAFDAHTTVSYTGAATASNELFSNCTKAIISKNNNLTADKLYIKNCDFGIMNYNLMSKDVSVLNNKIENAHIGTQLSGNYKHYDVNTNDISLTAGVEVSNAGYGIMALMYPAMGIDIKQLNPPYDPSETHLIQHNTITIPYYSGKGIANLGANASQVIEDNTINFTVQYGTGAPALPYQDPSLYGIYNSHCNEIVLNNNYVNGQYSAGVYQNTFSKAYYFETSKDMQIICNKAKATKQGLYAWGDNKTKETYIRSNKFKYNLNPLYTLDNGAAQPGTFGDIGDGSSDNNNFWLYNMPSGNGWLQNNIYKVWRNSNVVPTEVIKTSTNLLLQTESGSPGGNQYAYLVNNPPGMTSSDAECPAPDFGNSQAPTTSITIGGGDEIALGIASQSELYINYAEVGAWMNHRWLFEQLSSDETLRNSSPVLSAFYTNYQNGTIGTIHNVELALSALFNFEGTEQDYIAQYNDAINANSNLVLDEDYEINVHLMNDIALKIARYGIDSLNETQKLELEVLANTCPFVGGSAVYTARSLYTLLNPLAQYNDRLLCIQGQNKNSDGFVNLDSLYEAQTNEEAENLAQLQGANVNYPTVQFNKISTDEFEDILIYPNPASSYVNISNYNDAGTFELYNALGQKVLSQNLNEGHIQRILLPKLSNGSYSYKIVDKNKTYFGKLNILQNE